MATHIATANGNFTTGATWAVVDATSLLDAENGTTTLTTAFVESQTFTPGAITIDGIAVKVAGRATTPTGTMTCRLSQAAALVPGTSVTINVSDIPRANALGSDSGNGWIFFKFAAPVLLVAATAYSVGLTTSNASQVSVFRNATAANYSRMLRTTTTGAPAAGDNWHVLGEWTAAATKTNRTVTMDQTATTDYGGASTTIASFTVGVGGTVTWGTTAATAYILRLSGILLIATGGVFTIGTDPDAGGTAMPRDSSAELQFDCAADGDFGYICWGTLAGYGLSRTSGKNVVQCLLNTDEAIGQTVLGVDTDTGWLNGDIVALAATSQTATDAESGTLNGAAGASSITVSVAITAAHSGTSPNQAEVILLTRNVRIVAVTSTFVWYGQVNAGAVIDFSWTQFRYFGTSSTKNAAFYVTGIPTSFNCDFCSGHDSEGSFLVVTGIAGGTGVTFTLTDCTFYRCGVDSSSNHVVRCESPALGFYTLTRVTAIFDSNISSGWGLFQSTSTGCQGFTFDTCRASSGLGFAISITSGMPYTAPKIIRNSVFHCIGGATGVGVVSFNAGSGQISGIRISNCTFRRNPMVAASTACITLSQGVGDVDIEDCTFVASGNGGICFSRGAAHTRVLDCVFAGDASFGQTAGVLYSQSNQQFGPHFFENCTFGVGTAHSTADFNQTSFSQCFLELVLTNCLLASGTEFQSGLTTGGASGNAVGRSYIARHRKDQVTNVHERVYQNLGTVAYETTTFRTAAPAEKMTPTVGVLTSGMEHCRLRSSVHQIPVASGKQITPSVYVRKDSTYNGGQPRLILRANPAIGLDTDLTLKTMVGGADQWEQLTGQHTPAAEEDGFVEVYVDCDGSAGNVYVDDWSAAST